MDLQLCKSCNKKTAILENGKSRCILCGAVSEVSDAAEETRIPPPGKDPFNQNLNRN